MSVRDTDLNKPEKIQDRVELNSDGNFVGILLAISCICLVAILISFTLKDRSYFVWLAFTYFPIFWASWLIVYIRGKFNDTQRIKMKAAWIINSLAIMLLLLSLSLIPKIITDRCFVEAGDIAAISFLPIAFPLGLLSDYLFVLLDKFLFRGDGNFYLLIRSQGLQFYAFIIWLNYTITGFFQTWVIIWAMQHLLARRVIKGSRLNS